MSATADSTSSSDSNADAPAPQPEKKPKGRRWRRIAIVSLCAVIVLALAARLTMVFALPPVLKKVAAGYDLDVTYAKMDLYALGGDVGLSGLKIRPKAGGDSIVDAEYVRAHISPLNLLRGKLVVHRAEMDGVDMLVERLPDGTIPLLQKFSSDEPMQWPTSLDPPLQIEALRVNKVRAHWIDRSVQPLVDTRAELTLRLSDFGLSDKPARFLLDMSSPPLVDVIRIEGTGNARGKSAEAAMSVVMRGVHPKPAAGYLVPLGLSPVGESLHVTCNAKFKAAATTQPAGGANAGATTRPADFNAEVALSDVAVIADGREAAGVDKVLIKADSIQQYGVQIASVLVDGARASARRTPAGMLSVAGLDFVPAPASPTTAPSGAKASPAPAAKPTSQPAPLMFELADLTVKNTKATFTDESVAPRAEVAFLVNSLSVKNVVADPARPDATAQITGDFAAPGVARSIKLAGTARPFAPTRTLAAKLSADGIRPDAIRAYLDAAGVETTMKEASASCDLSAAVAQKPDGQIAASLIASGIKLTDGGGELFAFDAAKVSGVSINPANGSLRVEAVELAGPRLAIERDADGSLRAAGLHALASTTQPAKAGTAAAKPKPQIAAAAGAAPTTGRAALAGATTVELPNIEVGKLAWKNVAITFTDRAVTPAKTVTLKDAGVELSGLKTAVAPGAAAPPPGKVRAWLVAPEIAGDVAVNGTLTPSPDGFAADLNVAAKKLNIDLLAPYLKSAGVEPTLKDGSIELRARAGLSKAQGGGTAVALGLENFRFLDGKDELVAVDGLRVQGVKLGTDGSVAVDGIEVNKPWARVEREADGSFRLAGVRIAPPTTVPSASTEVAEGPIPQGRPGATTRPANPPPPALVATLSKLRVNDASLVWIDRAVQPPVNAVGRANVELDGFVFGKKAEPAKFKVTTKVDETLEEFVAAGTVSPDPSTLHVLLDLAGRGIRQGVIGAYLPPGTQVATTDGRFRARVEAGAATNPQGGRSAKLSVSGLDWRDGESQQPLARFDSAKVIVSRADVPGGVVAIDEVSLNGLEAAATKTADGALRVLGLSMSEPKAPAAPAAANGASVAAATIPPDAARGPTTPPSTVAATTAPADVNAMLARQLQKPPLVTLDKLDVQVKRLSYADQSLGKEAEPISVADLRLRNPKRIELLGDDAINRPPTELEITGRVDPIAAKFLVGVQAAPFASPATLNVDVKADGIRGQDVTKVVPDLREKLDGQALTNGQFAARLESQAKLERRGGPHQIDLGKPFEVSATLRDVAYRAEPNGAILAGVEEVRVEPVRVDPKTGSVTVRTLEITKPTARAYRDADGIHVLGMLIKTGAAATQPAPEQTATKPTEAPKSEAQLASMSSDGKPAAAAKPQAEMRIDKLIVSGIDVAVEDRSVDPPLLVPLNSLEVEVRDLSNLALYEPRPIRFNVLAGSAKVPMYDGKQRELFSEVAASGAVSLYPRLGGWARSSVTGFELQALRGTAGEYSVNIEKGTFDSSVEVRFRDSKEAKKSDAAAEASGTATAQAGAEGLAGSEIDVRSKFAFTSLRMSEPKNGPLQRHLQLPGPLDMVIIALQDPSGSITVPLSFPVKEGEISGVAGAAVGALASVVGTAVASAPIKVVGGVGELVGLGGKKKEKGPQPAGEIDFAPGVADPLASSRQSAPLYAVIERLQKDKTLEVTLRHEFGPGDLERAAERANPSPEECAALAKLLRARKATLVASRERVASQARAVLIADPNRGGGIDGGGAIAALRSLDQELAATDDALDEVYGMLRPGAERQADRRTRVAALQLADARMETLKEALTRAGIPDAEQRVKVIRPSFSEEPSQDANAAGTGGVAGTQPALVATADGGNRGGRVLMVLIPKKKQVAQK